MKRSAMDQSSSHVLPMISSSALSEAQDRDGFQSGLTPLLSIHLEDWSVNIEETFHALAGKFLEHNCPQ